MLFFAAIPLLGWNATISNLASTSFTLQWINLNTVINYCTSFYIVEIKSIQDFLLTAETFPGNTTTTVINGLSPSTKYRVGVFGVDGTGRSYKNMEVVTTTKKGTKH